MSHSNADTDATERHRFINRLRIAMSLDQHEVGFSDPVYDNFAANPFRFLMRCDDPQAEAIWAAVKKREAPRPAGDV